MSDDYQDVGYSRNGSVLCDSYQHLPELFEDHWALGVIYCDLPVEIMRLATLQTGILNFLASHSIANSLGRYRPTDPPIKPIHI